jgi:hypothetical protein
VKVSLLFWGRERPLRLAQRLHEGGVAVCVTFAKQQAKNETPTPSPSSLEVEAIEVHHFGPGRNKVFEKLFLRVRAAIDFSQCPQLGV